MAKADKAAAIAELSDKFRNSGAAVLTEYRGLSVKQITDLRNSLRGNATFAVVKNTLTELAAKDAGVTAFDGQLVGPSAIAFVDGDPVEAEGPVAAAAAPAAEAEVADDNTGAAPAVDVTEETPAEAHAAEATADVAEGGDES